MAQHIINSLIDNKWATSIVLYRRLHRIDNCTRGDDTMTMLISSVLVDLLLKSMLMSMVVVSSSSSLTSITSIISLSP
jgi:hypothetical protein